MASSSASVSTIAALPQNAWSGDARNRIIAVAVSLGVASSRRSETRSGQMQPRRAANESSLADWSRVIDTPLPASPATSL